MSMSHVHVVCAVVCVFEYLLCNVRFHAMELTIRDDPEISIATNAGANTLSATRGREAI